MSWTAESISLLATAYWHAQTLLAGVESGVFEALPGTVHGVAEEAGTDVRVTAMLLEALTGLGVLMKQGEVFDLVPSAQPFLVKGSDTSLVEALKFNSQMYGLFGKLTQTVKTGAPALPPTAHLGQDPTRTKAFVIAMESRGKALLPPILPAIDLPADKPVKVLDVGSGAGTLSRLLAEKLEKARFTCIDLPSITEVATGLTAAHPARERITHLPADYLTAPLPGSPDFDAIIYCGALHQHTPEQAGQLIKKLTASLKPSGTLYIIDFFAGPDRKGPAFPMLFALSMALISPTAHTHSTTEAAGYLTAAGLGDPAITPMSTSLYRVIKAVKPA